jgi:hypothetical protein
MESSTLSTISRLAKEYACNAVLLVGDPDQAAFRDLLAQLPRVGLATEHSLDLSDEAGGDSHLTVVDPEIWAGLSWEERQQPRMVPLQLRFAPGSLARAARALRWESV